MVENLQPANKIVSVVKNKITIYSPVQKRKVASIEKYCVFVHVGVLFIQNQGCKSRVQLVIGVKFVAGKGIIEHNWVLFSSYFINRSVCCAVYFRVDNANRKRLKRERIYWDPVPSELLPWFSNITLPAYTPV